MIEVVSVVIHVPDVRNVLFLAIHVRPQAEGHQPVLVAAGNPQQLQHFGGLGRIRNQHLGHSRVGRRREPADLCERIEVAQAEVERLPAAHRKPGHRAVFAIGIHGIVRFNERNDVLDQIALEGLSPAVARKRGRVAIAAEPAAPATPAAAPGVAAALVVALPLGKTTIMGSLFLSAIRLSMTTLAAPPLVHSRFSLPPMPCNKNRTGYFLSLE